MKILDFKKTFISKLNSIYDEMEIESFFYMILEHKKKLNRIDLALDQNLILSKSEIQDFESILSKLARQIPIQYLLGESHFFGLVFEVNPSVLIPRPETEELVEWILKDENIVEKQKSNQEIQVLDIGTGSGCIAISLGKNITNAQVLAFDVSEKALEIAQKNADTNNLKVNFVLQNILTTKDLPQKYDVIVSNPPYVRMLEKKEISTNVLDNEPHLALFVENDDALIFYRKIGALAKNHLLETGALFFEINQYLAAETKQLMLDLGYVNIELKKDVYGNDRMMKVS
jgi:release factor glutamine methyltransferase